jgi:nucleotide-binding universal stress UspA family protein
LERKILVSYDGSENAQGALRYAIEMAEKYNDSLLVLHVVTTFEKPNTDQFFSRSSIEDYQASLHTEAMATATPILKDANIEYEIKMRIGIPKVEICEEADEQNVRCIIMGSRGYSAFVASVLGSVSQGVLYRANCPVMIVPS